MNYGKDQYDNKRRANSNRAGLPSNITTLSADPIDVVSVINDATDKTNILYFSNNVSFPLDLLTP